MIHTQNHQLGYAHRSLGPLYSSTFLGRHSIDWVVPRNSHHQDYSIFSRESRTKPLFVTVTGRGVDRRYICISILYIIIYTYI